MSVAGGFTPPVYAIAVGFTPPGTANTEIVALGGRRNTNRRRKRSTMSNLSLPLTRRQLAQLALAGTASALLMTPNAPTPAEAAPALLPKPTEGEALTQAVPAAAGYALSESQSKEAALALKGYPGSFSKARVFAIANDIEPAFAPYAPAAPGKKGASR